MNPCTIWFRFDPRNGEQFNHVALGHSMHRRPLANSQLQTDQWARAQWRREFAWLTNDVPPKVTLTPPEDVLTEAAP